MRWLIWPTAGPASGVGADACARSARDSLPLHRPLAPCGPRWCHRLVWKPFQYLDETDVSGSLARAGAASVGAEGTVRFFECLLVLPCTGREDLQGDACVQALGTRAWWLVVGKMQSSTLTVGSSLQGYHLRAYPPLFTK
jgi:hypothetical protein